MKKVLIATSVVAAFAAAPAAANEARVEARAGVIWALGQEEAVAGVAAGYDFDLGESAFFGVEASADKALVDGADVVLGTTARLGLKMGEGGKLFAAGGYSFNNGDAFHLGAGFQQKVSGNVYLKAEYRHFFDNVVDVDAVTAGVGITF